MAVLGGYSWYARLCSPYTMFFFGSQHRENREGRAGYLTISATKWSFSAPFSMKNGKFLVRTDLNLGYSWFPSLYDVFLCIHHPQKGGAPGYLTIGATFF